MKTKIDDFTLSKQCIYIYGTKKKAEPSVSVYFDEPEKEEKDKKKCFWIFKNGKNKGKQCGAINCKKIKSGLINFYHRDSKSLPSFTSPVISFQF